MADPVEMMLDDLTDKYANESVSKEFLRLYTDEGRFGRIFAGLHEKLNEHFIAINGRAKSGRHYWADNSRALIALIDELSETLSILRRAGFNILFIDYYDAVIRRCKPWLAMTHGSEIPEGFEYIEIFRYEPVFSQPETAIAIKKQRTTAKLQLIGEGSYAHVFSFVDPDYNIKFAVKRAKKGLDERDLHRFKEEFKILRRLSFPYVVEAYEYDEARNEYKMEFCNETLRDFIRKRNNKLSFGTRKRIALQFLYGINYTHSQRLFHRDLGLQNILLKVYAGNAVLVKLSDFGLAKDHTSNFTRTHTEMRGTIRDPMLASFREYGMPNEVYAIGWILSYIFTGRESLAKVADDVGEIVHKCTNSDVGFRYSNVQEIIVDVERLESIDR
ncbi:protein kinase-like protein [Actinocorallia herbida]|uniref:Protein kinase-like protein n=1 Tax=Actinocorallia herbida TaxID=58109 RepID=A0A3N1DCN2_9ACTN|nr:protein kinase family protein [Actinocorallia herbida]ROO90888.1 protein kinase-like protein [Actinocorallia herbida]